MSNEEIEKIKIGDTIKCDSMIRIVHFKKGKLGYTSGYGDFVALENSDLPWVVK